MCVQVCGCGEQEIQHNVHIFFWRCYVYISVDLATHNVLTLVGEIPHYRSDRHLLLVRVFLWATRVNFNEKQLRQKWSAQPGTESPEATSPRPPTVFDFHCSPPCLPETTYISQHCMRSPLFTHTCSVCAFFFQLEACV